MRVLVCDDDLFFAEKVQKAVSIYFGAKGSHVDGKVCTTAEQVLSIPQLETYQLAFLDISIGDANGIKLGRQLKYINPSIVLVYISEYLEYAPEGYTVNAFRYILKSDVRQVLPSCLEDAYNEVTKKQKYLSVQISREIYQIPYDSIFCLQSSTRQILVFGENRYTPICTYYGKLSGLPQEMYQEGFLRVGRSAVVNMRYIEKVSAYKLRLKNGMELGISRELYSKVYGTYLEWQGRYSEV